MKGNRIKRFNENSGFNMSDVRSSIFKIRRKTKGVFIVNSWAIGGGWRVNVTSIDLMLFGIKIKNLHKYYITYRGEFSDLRGTQYYTHNV